MRIIFVSNLCPPHAFGGYERACLNTVRYLADTGHQVKLLTAATHLVDEYNPDFIYRCFELNAFDPVTTTDKSITAYLSCKSRVSSIHNCNVFLDHILAFQPDIIVFYNLIGIGGLALIDIVNNLQIPWLFHLMDKVPADLIANEAREILAMYNAVDGALFHNGKFISSKRNVDELLRHGIDIRSQTRIITVWTKTPPAISRAAYQQDGTTRFIFSGYICEQKGVAIILQAARILLDQSAGNFVIDFYGPGSIIHYAAAMVDLDLQHHCHFHGQISQEKMRKLFTRYDCLLFPTWEREPFGFVVLEASAAACVPVITESCGAAEALINGENCIKTARDAQSLAKVMAKIMNGEFNLPTIGNAAANNALNNYHFDKIMQEISEQIHLCVNTGVSGKITHDRIMQQRRLQYVKDLYVRTLAF